MPKSELFTQLVELWADIQRPAIFWQVAVLVGCMLAAYYIQRSVLAWMAARPGKEDDARRRIGRAGLRRVLFPLTALVLVFVARSLLGHFQRTYLLNLAIPLLGSLAVIRAVVYALRQAFGASAWMAGFERVFATVAWAIVALHILGWLPEVIAALEGVNFKVGKNELSLWLLLQAVVSVLVTLLAALWVAGLLEQKLMATEGLDASIRLMLARVAKSVLVVVAVMIALPMVGLDITTLSVFGGALGVGLGLGLQKIAANYVSGFILLMDRSIRIGNLISVGQERGVVSYITTRYTVLNSANGVDVIVPNETLIGSVVQNETFTNTRMSVPIDFQVAYDTDLDLALATLVELGREHRRVLPDPAPAAFVVSFGESGINLRLLLWIDDPKDGTLGVKSEVNLAVWRRFRELDIQMPFPQREVRLVRCEGAAVAEGDHGKKGAEQLPPPSIPAPPSV